jgi:SAM-dependent methyltransferase
VFYGEDLARVHDAGFGQVARAAAGTLVDELRRAGFHGGLVVDLACGTGIGAELLIAAGYEVLGADVSADQLAIARRRAPDARFELASLHDFEPPPCVAVAIAGEGLCYASDPRAGRDGARRVFERAYAALAPGGLLLFDVVEPGREQPEPRRRWTEGDGWLVCVEAWEAERLLQRRIVTFVRAPDGSWRRSDEHHTQHELERDEVLADLDAAGFDARVLDGSYAGFLAVKR